MSILDDYFQVYGDAMQRQWFGVTIALQRGESSPTLGIVANWSKPETEAVEDSTYIADVDLRVYRIAVDDYQINGVAVAPQVNDVIKESVAGVMVTRGVLPVPGLPAFERGGDGRHWIVRTKRA